MCLISSGADELFRSLGLHGVDRNLLLVAAQTLEAHDAVDQSEQGIVLALAHVQAGMDLGATLTDQNVAGQGELTIGTLRAKALAFAVATL